MVLILLLILPTPTEQGIIAGPGCFMACFTACATMGPGKFAAFVGIVFDIAGCAAMCGPVCAMALPIPGVCFAPTTTFLDVSLREVNAALIKKGDIVYTLTEGRMIQTTVNLTMKIEGEFDFVKIHLNNLELNRTTSLMVTGEHGVIVFEKDQQKTIQAKNVSLGNEMIGFEHRKWRVQEIEKLMLMTRHVIQTETGTVLASGILATTSCF